MIWCLGDVIGYGPDPNECVALLREQEHLSLSGNHDWAVLGRLDKDSFNEDARVAINWTQRVLTEENRDYLEELPSLLVKEPFTLAHASPRQPVWEYILEQVTAAANFDHFETPYCLVGHTHAPVIYEQSGNTSAEAREPLYAEPIALNEVRLIINPGSVGQPRDYDPRAAYAILDGDELTWEHRRVSYPVEQTQARMSGFGLPYRLVARLEFGW
jgi:diadenosine tetraphosphatase ApaH/serine/threonine PP2A family protein phosphatase